MAANNANDFPRPKSFEEGWAVMQEAVDRVINVAEGHNNNPITSEDYMRYYTIAYGLCYTRSTIHEHSYSQELRNRYRKALEEYITQKVLPSLQEKENPVVMLRELIKRWSNYRIVIRWLMRFFYHLDRLTNIGPSLEQIGYLSFYDLVFGEMNCQITDACIFLIDKEREGEQIDQALVRDVTAIFAELWTNTTKNYAKGFVDTMLKDSAEFYARKASSWIESDSYNEYMVKANDCLKHEIDTVSLYLPDGIRYKFLQVIEHELLTVRAIELLQNEAIA